jgi:uncharacterized protein YqgC (DUF456 family)
MLYLWLTILILLNALCLVLVIFGIPGNWLMVILTCLFAWWQRDAGVFSGGTLIAIAVLALMGELIEFLAGTIGAKRSGASWQGSLAAIFGAMLGALVGTLAIPIPLVGTLVGASIGAGLTVWVIETFRGQSAEHSLRRAFHAGLGQILGTSSKMAIGVVIWLVITVAAFWP